MLIKPTKPIKSQDDLQTRFLLKNSSFKYDYKYLNEEDSEFSYRMLKQLSSDPFLNRFLESLTEEARKKVVRAYYNEKRYLHSLAVSEEDEEDILNKTMQNIFHLIKSNVNFEVARAAVDTLFFEKTGKIERREIMSRRLNQFSATKEYFSQNIYIIFIPIIVEREVISGNKLYQTYGDIIRRQDFYDEINPLWSKI